MAVPSPPTPVATPLGTPCNTSPRDLLPLPFLNCHLTSDTTHGTARTSPLDPHTYDLIRLPTAPSTPLSTTGPSTPIRLVSPPVSNVSSPTHALPVLPASPAASNAATPMLMHPVISNLPTEESKSLGLSGMAKPCKTIAPVLWASPTLAPVDRKAGVVDRRLLKPRELEAEDSPVDDGTNHIRLPEVDDADSNVDSDTEPELLAKRATSEGTDALWADAERYMKRMRLDNSDEDDMSV